MVLHVHGIFHFEYILFAADMDINTTILKRVYCNYCSAFDVRVTDSCLNMKSKLRTHVLISPVRILSYDFWLKNINRTPFRDLIS